MLKLLGVLLNMKYGNKQIPTLLASLMKIVRGNVYLHEPKVNNDCIYVLFI